MHILQPLEDKTAVEIWKQNLFPFPETRFTDMDQSGYLRFIIRSVVWKVWETHLWPDRCCLSQQATESYEWDTCSALEGKPGGWSSGEVLYEESLRSRWRMWSSAYRPVTILKMLLQLLWTDDGAKQSSALFSFWFISGEVYCYRLRRHRSPCWT